MAFLLIALLANGTDHPAIAAAAWICFGFRCFFAILAALEEK